MSYTTLQLKTFSFELIYCFKMCFKIFFTECKKKTLGKEALCRVSKKNTRQRSSLPSVKKTLGKESLCRVLKKTLGKEPLCRVSKKNTRQRWFCRVPEKQHSTNHLALGKEPVSGSGCIFSDTLFASNLEFAFYLKLVIHIVWLYVHFIG